MMPGLKSDAGKEATAAGLRGALTRLAGPHVGCCVLPISPDARCCARKKPLSPMPSNRGGASSRPAALARALPWPNLAALPRQS